MTSLLLDWSMHMLVKVLVYQDPFRARNLHKILKGMPCMLLVVHFLYSHPQLKLMVVMA